MAVGPFAQQIHKLARDEILVPDNVRLSSVIEIEGEVWRFDGKEIDQLIPGLRGVPVKRVSSQTNPVVNPPLRQLISATDRQRTGEQPAIPIFVNRLSRGHRQGRGGAQLQKKRSRTD